MSFHRRKDTFVDPRVASGRVSALVRGGDRVVPVVPETAVPSPLQRLRRLPTRAELRAAELYDVEDFSGGDEDGGGGGGSGGPGRILQVSPTHATKKVLSANQTRMERIAAKLEQKTGSVTMPQRDEWQAGAPNRGNGSSGGIRIGGTREVGEGSRRKLRPRRAVNGAGTPLASGNFDNYHYASPSSAGAKKERHSSVSLTEIRKMMLTPKAQEVSAAAAEPSPDGNHREVGAGGTSIASDDVKRSPASVINRRALAKERMARRWKLVRDNVVSPQNRADEANRTPSAAVHADRARPKASPDENAGARQVAAGTRARKTALPRSQRVVAEDHASVPTTMTAAATAAFALLLPRPPVPAL